MTYSGPNVNHDNHILTIM